MGASNVNVVVIEGNLTKDPELRSTGGGTSVCEMRVAVNARRKDGQTGEWFDKPNYFNVTVWGAQGENCANYLAKGRPVAIEGRLDWREWEAKDGSGKRQAIQIIANHVRFLGSKPETGGEGEQQELPASEAPAASTGGSEIDPSQTPDDELAALEREQLDAVAIEAGVERPEQYRQRRQVVRAIRESEAARTAAELAEDDIPF